MKIYKAMLAFSAILAASGYAAAFIFAGAGSANSFLIGFCIVLADLALLARLLNNAAKNASPFSAVLLSFTRWAFIGFCIYAALVLWKVDKIPFIIGVSFPFIGVFITGIYQIFRGKENGTSS